MVVNHNNRNTLEEGKRLKQKLTERKEMKRRAATLPRDYCGHCVQMRLSYSPLAPLFLHFIEWMDYSCRDALPNFLGLLHILVYKVYADGIPITSSSQEKVVTPKDFYAVIYPLLKQLEANRGESEEGNKKNRRSDHKRNQVEELERDEECGICLEPHTKMVLPECGHSMCIRCFDDWSSRSQSCPFCRGCLNWVSSKDLWVLVTNCDIIDTSVIARENVSRFYPYMDALPALEVHDAVGFHYYEYII